MDGATSESLWLPEAQYDDGVKAEEGSSMYDDVEDEKPSASDLHHEPNIMYMPLEGVDEDENYDQNSKADDPVDLSTQLVPEEQEGDHSNADGSQRRSNAKRKCRENAEVAIANSVRRENDDDSIVEEGRNGKDASDDDADRDDGSDVSITPTRKAYKTPKLPAKPRPAAAAAANTSSERKGFFSASTSNAASKAALKPWTSVGQRPGADTSKSGPPSARKLFGFNNSSRAPAPIASSTPQKGFLLSSPSKSAFKTRSPPLLKSSVSFKASSTSKQPVRVHSSNTMVKPKTYQQAAQNKPKLSLTSGSTSRPSQFSSFGANGGNAGSRVVSSHVTCATKSMQTDAPEVYPTLDRNDKRRALRKVRAPKKDAERNDGDSETNIDVLIDRVRYKCKYCEKLMRTEASIRRHVSLHTNLEGYGCSQCDARYPTRDDLRLHERVVHEGECNFRCSACNYLFVRASYLRTHVRTQAHKDVVAGKAKPKPQVFKDGLPMHSKPLSDARRPINKKVEEKITDGPEWDTIIPPELKTALAEAHRKQQERLEEARRNVIRAGGGYAKSQPAAPAATTKNAAAESNNSENGEPARADGVPKVVSGTISSPPAAAVIEREPTPPPITPAPPTEENLQKFLAQLIRRQAPGESTKLHQAEKLPVKIYRYNYCAVCKRYIDDPANPLGMRLHRHTKTAASGEKKSATDADGDGATAAKPTTTNNAGTDTSDLNVDNSNSSVGGDKPPDGSTTNTAAAGGEDDENAVNKLTLWKSIDVKLDVPYYWDPQRTIDFVYKKKPGFVRAVEYGSKKFFENRTRLKKDFINFENDKRMQVVLQNVDFTDPEMLSYLNFDNSSLKPPSKFIAEKYRKSYYDPLRKYQQQDQSSGADDDGIGPAVMFGGNEEYALMNSDEADHYVRVRIDKWQQAIKIITDLRSRVTHYEQSYGVEEPAAQMASSLNHSYTSPQHHSYSSTNRRGNEMSMLSAVLVANDDDDGQHYVPAGSSGNRNNVNNRVALQKPTPVRRSTRAKTSRNKQQSDTSSDDDEDEESESEEEPAPQQQQQKRPIQSRAMQNDTPSDAAKRLRAAQTSKATPTAAVPVMPSPQQQQQVNKHSTRTSARHAEQQYQQQNVATLAHTTSAQNNRYQPASTHGMIEPSVIFPGTQSSSTSNSSAFGNNVRNTASQQQQQTTAQTSSNPNSSLYVRADEPHEVQRLLQQGWTISGLLPASASHMPSMAAGLHAQQQQQHPYHRNWN